MLTTTWGEALDREHPLQEYPRPQLRRESYLNLNGPWEYAFTRENMEPEEYDGEIIVPFAPESELSGVGRTLRPGEYLWYHRSFTLPEGFHRGRVILHFGAVDQTARVWVNGVDACAHTGGYLSFSADITELLYDDGSENSIVVRVTDDTDKGFRTRGKQKLKKGGIWYTPSSGIWQTVWCESVPENYIRSLFITPHPEQNSVELFVDGEGPCRALIGDLAYDFYAGAPALLKLGEQARLWSPEDPYLYELSLALGEDRVESYFAMRSFSVGEDAAGVKRLFLNGKPYFHNGVLDQGWWPDGLYTAPSDEALRFDIETAKAMGFNMLRKHVKIEPLRWYYHCDRLGLVVWQDMVNGGGRYNLWFVTYLTNVLQPLLRRFPDGKACRRLLSRAKPAGREEYAHELADTVQALRCHPCIACWVPFNEGWGQFDAGKAVQALRALDGTRLVDEASGWFDRGGGDVHSIHNYFYPLRIRPNVRTVALSEYGGIAWPMPGHEPPRKTYGYGTVRSRAELTGRYRDLQLKTILPQLRKGLSALVYTQLTDVEDEVNGLFTYDRRAIKPEAAAIRAVNEALEAEFEKVVS